mmetsp:Transcript_764/g.1819  ORF Transcript_764/g.1819 Transcript_764/m.1819 type:complete len:278 (+) Transcript_764:660-1493(+)
MGLTSGVIGAVIQVHMREPVRTMGFSRRRTIWDISRQVVSTPTWLLIVAQGMIGGFPWVAFGSFSRLFFQYVGFSDAVIAGMLVVCGLFGASGNYIGGILGDMACKRSVDHGRVFVGQMSVILGAIFACVMLIIPRTTDYMVPFVVVMSCVAMVGTWTPAATLRPIVSEISDEETRGIVLGYWLALEGCAAALGAPAVAVLSQDFFHYVPTNRSIAELTADERRVNADALGNALGVTMLVPWAICAFFFTLMHCTYPSDRRRFALLAVPMSSVQESS